MNAGFPFVSVVIIGLNEERNIKGCVESIGNLNYPKEKLEIIYVDSGSTDKTIEIVKKYPVKMIKKDTINPSAGLGRNIGAQVANGEFIQFVDGDMTIDSKWLGIALPFFDKPEIASVIGRCKENPENRGIFNQIIGIYWYLNPLGMVESPASGGLFRREYLLKAGLYNTELKAYEETELGERIRKIGGKILSLDSLMVVHNHPRNLSGYLRRGIRGGFSRLQWLEKCFKNKDKMRFRAVGSLILHDGEVVAGLISFITGLVLGNWIYFIIFVILAIILILRSAYNTFQKTSSLKMSFLYALDSHFLKIPSLIGQIKYIKKKIFD